MLHLFCKPCIFAAKKEMGVHFGERFFKAREYVKDKYHLDFYEIAAHLKVENTTASRWIHKEKFPRTTQLKLERLSDFGINPLFFKEESVTEMFLPGAEMGFEAEVVKAFTETGEAIKEQENDLKEIARLLNKLIEADKESKKTMAAILSEIEVIKKNMRKR